MKKLIYISGSASIVILLMLFYFNSVSSNTSNNLTVGENPNLNQDFDQNGDNHSSFSPQTGGWQLQTMPNMGNRLVRDLYFTDSLTGYAVASPDAYLDSAHILKTTNGGYNWNIKATYGGRLKKVKFINALTGYAGGNKFLKTTNAGENWTIWNWTVGRIMEDMFVVSEDTIWYGDSEPIYGGAFRTTNGGINWEKRDSGIPANSYPIYIYFYNSRIGFATGNTNVYKTTDAGISWNLTFSGGAQKLYFKDSLNGYRAMQGFFRTTNGGLNWSKDSLPSVLGNTYNVKWLSNFYVTNSEIIYGVGAYFQYLNNLSVKPIIYKSTNSGLNWGYQIPDTSFSIYNFSTVYSINNNVWCYDNYYNKGIFSPIGGDSTIYLGISQISNEVPKEYELGQNYPNPFNATSNIKYKILKSSEVRIDVLDILGRNIQTLVNEKHSPGTYQVNFNGENLGSGIYFYQMLIDNKIVQTRRMILIK
jgi:photosystem II stability/assembly factor-like uncharacterized protein